MKNLSCSYSIIIKLSIIILITFLMLFSQKSDASTPIDCGSAHEVVYQTNKLAKQAAYRCGTEWGTDWIASRRAAILLKYPNSILYENATTDEIVPYNPCLGTSGPRLAVGLNSYRAILGSAGAYSSVIYHDSPACWNILQAQFTASGKYYSYAKKCNFPFSDIEGECAAFCPPYAPNIKLSTAQCIDNTDVDKVDEQCKANPVVINTGEKLQVETDLMLGVNFPLKIQRIYRSFRSPESKVHRGLQINDAAPSGTARTGWVKHIQPNSFKGIKYDLESAERHLVDDILYAGNKSWQMSNLATLIEYTYKGDVRVNYGDKSENFIRAEDGSFTADYLSISSLNDDTLGERIDDKYWEYTVSSGEIVYFNKSAQITLIVSPSGYHHKYVWENNLTNPYQNSTLTISDDFDNLVVIKFGVANTLTSINASNGITITYGYDKYANLVSVAKSIPVDPNNPNEVTELTKSYHYENTDFPYALTGMTDEKGIRYATWTYDEIGRVIESKHANNVDKSAISYELNTTTFTNSLDKQTKYHYNMISGAKRLVNVEGVATASCAAANQAYTYHPTGRIKTQTDWEGNVTYFEYNIKGQVTKRTEGYGTPEAYTVETSWHETFNEPSVITYPDKQEKFTYNAQGKLINKSIVAL